MEQALADMQRAADSAGNSLRIPGPDASDEQRQEFYSRVLEKAPGLMPKPQDDESTRLALKALGLPDAPDKYAVPEVEGIALTDERIGELRAMAHEAGLTAPQFAGFLERLLKRDAEGLATTRAEQESALAQLRGEWGSAYDTRLKQITQLATATEAPESLLAAISDGTLTSDTLRWLNTLTERLGAPEGMVVGGQGKTAAAGPLTPGEALAQLDEVEAQLVGKFDIPPDRRKYLMKRRLDLMRAANGE